LHHRPIVLDGKIDAQAEERLGLEQRAIWDELKDLNVDVAGLIARFPHDEARHALLSETRLAVAVEQCRDQAPAVERLQAALPDIERHRPELEAELRDLIDELQYRGRLAAFYGAVPSEIHDAMHLTRLRRQRLAHLKIAPTGPQTAGGRQRRSSDRNPVLKAIQTRYMPKVRVDVYKAIAEQFEVRHKPGADGLMQWHREINALTVRFVRAFFPLWGKTTTPELVRKAVLAERQSAAETVHIHRVK
jgi:hypothetical protein